MTQLTLGSLFDGIGGFPLAGIYAGMKPVWASEIEPFPIRVTRKRLPDMRHCGDIHDLDGAELEPVDVITFGSPCQDLSVAGRRDGLQGGRSSLFFEAVRVITEMREATNGMYPKWAVWENVPGALSSNDGQDFRTVLERLVRIKEPSADVPLPENGKWLAAGEILGDGYSLAWRILDASKGWGVAQRRKRIFLVLDLAGWRAGKVLFESEGLSGYTPPGGEAREGTAGDPAEGAGAAGRVVLNDMGGARMDVTDGVTHTLRAQDKGHPPMVLDGPVAAGGFCTEHSADSRGVGYEDERAPTLRANVVPGVAVQYYPTDSRIRIEKENISQCLTARAGTGGNQTPLAMVPVAYGISADQSKGMLSDNPKVGFYEADSARTLDCGAADPRANQGGIAVVERKPAYTMTTGSFLDFHREVSPTLMARDYKDAPLVGTEPETEYLVRRLTPEECCRLQGFPDRWCRDLEDENPSDEEIAFWERIFEVHRIAMEKNTKPKTPREIAQWLAKPGADSAEYKAYGNSVCVYCVFFVLSGIVWAEELFQQETGTQDPVQST